MILLLEPHDRARALLLRELSRFDEVAAPDLGRLSVAEALAQALHPRRCRLVVCAASLPGSTPGSVVRLLRSYLPDLPVVLLTQGQTEIPALDGVLSVPYTDLGSLLGPTVAVLLEESGEELVRV